jgi:hypothetical protein
MRWAGLYLRGEFPYQAFHEANLDPHVGALVKKKKLAERHTN